MFNVCIHSPHVPFSQEMFSIGNPETGHWTWRLLPATALIGPIWRMNGGPENKETIKIQHYDSFPNIFIPLKIYSITK